MALTKVTGAGVGTLDSATITSATITNQLTDANMSAGSIVQIVQGTGNTEFDTTNSSFTKCTNLSVTITPKATSSKILLYVSGLTKTEQYTRYMMMTIFRNIGGAGDADISDTGTATDNTANGFLRIYDAGTSITEQHTTITFLDSPNTTSQIVYAPAIRHGTGNSPGAHFGVANGKCVMLAMEVAGWQQ